MVGLSWALAGSGAERRRAHGAANELSRRTGRGNRVAERILTPEEVGREVKRLIRWYEKRRKNWLLAAQFTLARHSGWCPHTCYICQRQQERTRGAGANDPLR